MYHVKRAIVWLYRWRHCRGFGVQSPNDYRFVRYVINEHAPYYAYQTLRMQYPDLSKEQRRFGELLLRVANDRQPDTCIYLTPPSPAYKAYLQAGCMKTKILEVNQPDEGTTGKADLICCWLQPKKGDTDIEALMQLTHGQSVIVLYGIRCCKASRQLWDALVALPAVTISYDLFDCGILFFDKKRYKHNYIINF